MKTNQIARLILACLLLSFSPMPITLGGGEKSPTWDYEGARHPRVWGKLRAEYETCATGLSQSPINFTASNMIRNEGNIETKYKDTPLTIENNGHTIQVNYAPGSYAMIGGKKYELKQFHFHTPSEHTLNGKAKDLELHLVHQNEQGEIAVIGVFIEEGKTNLPLATIWENLSKEQGIQTVERETINASAFLPKNPTYFHYQGSLTTPPCSENVSWNVMSQPLEASTQQIQQFMGLYPMNARPIQEQNDRLVEFRINH
jgi:carbonic anhydrase